MPPALGPLPLDSMVRTVVVGVLGDGPPGEVTRWATRGDAVWLGSNPTPAQVAAVRSGTGLPVGATIEEPAQLGALVDAGIAAVECTAPAAVAAVLAADLFLWCGPEQAAQALAAGVPSERIVCEGDRVGAAQAGVTVAGDGPAAWGQVVRAVHAGAKVVRSSDVGSVRRVVAVLDRIAASRAAGRRPVAS